MCDQRGGTIGREESKAVDVDNRGILKGRGIMRDNTLLCVVHAPVEWGGAGFPFDEQFGRGALLDEVYMGAHATATGARERRSRARRHSRRARDLRGVAVSRGKRSFRPTSSGAQGSRRSGGGRGSPVAPSQVCAACEPRPEPRQTASRRSRFCCAKSGMMSRQLKLETPRVARIARVTG